MLQKVAVHKKSGIKSIGSTEPSVSLSILNAKTVEEIREKQRMEGNFDCFGRAYSGYCDQADCSYYSDCTNISKAMTS